MDEQDRAFARHIEQLASRGGRGLRRGRALAAERTLQLLVADLVAPLAAAGMTRQDVADRMPSPGSVVSRLEGGVHARPTLTTIEK